MKRNTIGACITIVLLTATLACNRSPEARRDEFLSKGKAFMEQKEYSRAQIEFKNASQAMPRDAEPVYQMAMAAMAAGNASAAVAALRKAVELDPKHAKAQLKLSELMANYGDEGLVKDAEGHLKDLSSSDGEVGTEALRSLAVAELRLGNFNDAATASQRALGKMPGDLGVSTLLAQAKLAQKDAAGAEAILKEAVARAPKSADAHSVVADFYLSQNQLTKAETELQAALAIDPKSERALMIVARLQLSSGRKKEAEESFKRLSNLETAKTLYGSYLFREGRHAEAISEFERLYKANPEDRALRTTLVAAYRAVQRPQDADRVLNQALQKNPKDGDALLQRAETLIEAGKLSEAEADVNNVRRLRPNGAEVHFLLARLNKAKGSLLVYRQELAEALHLDPTMLPVRIELANQMIVNKDPKGALGLLNDGLPPMQQDSDALQIQRNWAYWALGDLAALRKGVAAAMQKGPSVDALLQDAMLKLASNDAAGGRASLQLAMKSSPSDLRVIRLLNEGFSAGNPKASLQAVRDFAAQNPKSAPAQQYLGSVLLNNKDLKGARQALEAAYAADPKFRDTQFTMVQVDVVEGKVDEALKRLESMLQSNPTDNNARLWMANLRTVKGENSKAIEEYRKVVAANPDLAEGNNNLAYLLSENTKEADEALRYAQKAVELDPKNPRYADTLGWIFYQKGIYRSAVTYLEQASSGDTSAVPKYHLAMAYAKLGERTLAQKYLDQATRINPNRPEAKVARGVLGEAR